MSSTTASYSHAHHSELSHLSISSGRHADLLPSPFTPASHLTPTRMGLFSSVKEKLSSRNSLSKRRSSVSPSIMPSGSNMPERLPMEPELPAEPAALPAPRYISPLANQSPPTRRPAPTAASEPPPAYTPRLASNTAVASSSSTPGPASAQADDPYSFLSHFDTIFLIDDSGSMAGRSWRETSAALRTIAPICTAHDADGIDIYFLNHPDSEDHQQVRSAATIERIFSKVRPSGGTPTGTRLMRLLRPYLARLEAEDIDAVKPLNIIVITDGVPSDDVESVIVSVARKLDRADAPPWQVGIQFFQVGKEPGAEEALTELDNGLAEMGGGVRDMVDTVPWTGTNGQGLNGEGILKVVLGAVNRRLDRKKDSGEWRRL